MFASVISNETLFLFPAHQRIYKTCDNVYMVNTIVVFVIVVFLQIFVMKVSWVKVHFKYKCSIA